MSASAPSLWRSLRRAALRLGLAVLALGLLWAAWHAYAAQRLSARLAAYRGRGEPTVLADLIPPPLPPSQNAYEIVLAVEASLALTPDENEIVHGPNRTYPVYLPLSEADLATARGMLARHGGTAALLRELRRHPRAAFPYNLSDPIFFDVRLGKLRAVMNYLRTCALAHHQDGRDDLVLEDLRDLRLLAEITDQEPLLLGHLVAVAGYALHAQAILHLAPDLQVQSSATPHGLPRAEWRALIESLLVDQPLHDRLRVSFHGERVLAQSYPARVASGTILLPLLRLDTLRVLRDYDALLHALGPTTPTYPAAKALFPPPAPSHSPFFASSTAPASNLERMDRLLSGFGGSVERAIELHHRGVTDRHAAAAALALRLYQIDHGQSPPTLQALVPGYLPAVPVDLFRADGGPLGYLPARRLVYSVGQNGTDDGAPAPADATRLFRPTWQEPDTLYPLDRPPPPPPPAPPTSSPSAPWLDPPDEELR